MKKLMGIMLCLLLVVSMVPFVVAQESTRVDTEVVQMDLASRQRIDIAREKFANAREKFNEAKEKRKNAEDDFQDLKDKVKECEDDESDECENVRADALEKAKEILLRAIETVDGHFDKLLARAEESGEDHADSVERLEAAKEKLADLKEQVEDAESKADIKKIAKEVRTFWTGFKKTAEKHAGKIEVGRFRAFTERTEMLIKRLDHAKTTLEEKGKDTAVIDRAINALETSLEEVKEMIDEAKSEYEAGNVATGRRILKEANTKLQSIHRKVTEAVKEALSKGMRMDELRAQRIDKVRDVAEKARDIADDARDRAENSREKVREQAEDAKEEMEGMIEEVREARAEAEEALDEAQDDILEALDRNEVVQRAQDTLEKARESFRAGDEAKAKQRYTLAEELYNEARDLAEDAKDLV